MKWEPVVAMVALVGLGFWLIYQPASTLHRGEFRQGATLIEYRVGSARGWIELADEPGGPTFRAVPREGQPSAVMPVERLTELLGPEAAQRVLTQSDNPWFRALNITSWSSVGWVVVGFAAQAVFAGRFLVQWIVSERQRKSTIPNAFWWMSLVGGLMLFVYFVWRQDPVGVFGQSSGIVIYARNLRLIRKDKRRQAREAASADNAADAPARTPEDVTTPATGSAARSAT